MCCKTIFFFGYWYYSCIRYIFSIQKESFRNNVKLITAIDDKINDEKLWYDINREAAKISTLSTVKVDKYEYLTDEKILPSDQTRVTEQAKFTYSPLRKAFEKQINKI